MLRKLMSLVALLAAFGAPALAQSGPFPQREFYASDYGQWQIPSQAANTYLFSPPGICKVSPPTAPAFLPFNTNAPIFIIDATAANSELVTPSSVTNTGSQCGVTVAPANNHYSFNLISGTGGLQETLNQIPSSVAYPVGVVLDRSWYTLMSGVTTSSPAAAIASVAGNSAAYLVDRTVVPNQYYSWNGSNYTPSASNATAPTPTAGTGAGGSPTIALVAGSTGTTGYVTLTSGTSPTASAAIMTLTWPAIASGGFQYAPSCTISSVGTRAYTSGVTTTTAGPPATAVLTASSTALTASVSGYKFKYTCH